jgi:dUTPase
MRLYKLDKNVEFPERVNEDGLIRYLNIRSSERIDVRPGETRHISTQLRVSFDVEKYETFIISAFDSTKSLLEDGEEVFVKVTNHGNRNIMIYPGQVVGELRGEEYE